MIVKESQVCYFGKLLTNGHLPRRSISKDIDKLHIRLLFFSLT